MLLQSLIRTAEQLKIKGLCEINEQTTTESDTEVIYPPHKKIRASRQYDHHHNNNNPSSSKSHRDVEATKSISEKDAQQIALTQDTEKRKSRKSPIKDIGKSLSKSPTPSASSSPSPSRSQNQNSKNMASLEMGMVSINLKIP